MSIPKQTKGGMLQTHRQTLRNAGYLVPPSLIVSPPFEQKKSRIEADLARFKKLCKPEGPLLPFLILRNNGRAEGTGEGESDVVRISAETDYIIKKMEAVQASDKNAQGVILQPFVGQLLAKDTVFGDAYAPVISGIAYTPQCSERGNAVVEWVFGHPKMAVKGEGNYIAFNRKTLMKEIINLELPRDFPDSYALTIPRSWSCSSPRLEIASGLGQLALKPGTRYDFLQKSFESVLNLGEKGPFYLEWAATYVKEQFQLFALQIAEFRGKIAGLPTWLHEAIHNFEARINQAGCEPADLASLRERYEKAVWDPKVIAAGFDVAGEGKKEFSLMLWKPNSGMWVYCEEELDSDFILAFGRNISAASLPGMDFGRTKGELKGFVEIEAKRVNGTFCAHAAGYCREHSILGLGSVQSMEHKLYKLSPGRFSKTTYSDLLIKGKFVLEVDESIPFGTLRVERLDKIIDLSRRR